jgi:hypothetical protein
LIYYAGLKGIPLEEDQLADEDEEASDGAEAATEAPEDPAAEQDAADLAAELPAEQDAEQDAEPKIKSTRRCATCIRLAPNHKAACALTKVRTFFVMIFRIRIDT